MRVIVWRSCAVVLVLLGAVVTWRAGLLDPDAVKARGWLGVVLFVALYALATLMPVPKAVFSLASGAIFGVTLGLLATMTGAVLGASAAFASTRLLGRNVVDRYGGHRVGWLDATFARRGILAVIALRLVPVVPFTAMNYAAGLTSVRWRDYVLGTVVGIAPSAGVYTVLGAYGRDPGAWPFRVALISLIALTVFAVTGAWLHRRRKDAGSAATPPTHL